MRYDMDLRLFIYFVSLYGVTLAQPPPYSTDLETSLRTELFTNYSVLQRPDARVNVKVALTLLTINDMNIKDQTLSISGYLTLDWLDSRLAWNDPSTTSQDYSNIRFLFSTETYVWRPAIIIENSVDDISVISDTNIPMRLQSDGRIAWSPAGIYKVSCEADTTYYPLDYQACWIKVSTWGYTQTEITLHYDTGTPVELGFYSENGEWELISAEGTITEDRSRGGQTFSTLTFQINLQRRALFHVLNTLFPVALMAVLIPMTFKLPSDSGEKIGYSLTVLLAYAVYLTLISDNIPSTSVTVCYLSVFLALTLMYGTIAVILVILVLMVHHKTEHDQIPAWLKKFTTKFLMPVTCWKRSVRCNREAVAPISEEHVVIEAPDDHGKKGLPLDGNEHSKPKEETELEWNTISAVLDNFFFIVMMTLVLLTTLIIFAVIVAHYDQTS
ncbi:hypothetical protein FSP39_014069 [Pinctada imbricata]|uniref:Uncharacterized protein n=1 Tax=Pinctada imbricata TaxID=66713 RepID=A0AA88Y053_PINIB|nr:hypothetical protein FSP39_014069 [Pinctada imbricata]